MTPATSSRDAGPEPWGRARNLLAVRLDTMGDVLMTSPALRALKEAVPGRRVTLLTSPQGAEAAHLIPAVDEVIVYEAPWMKHSRGTSVAPDHAMIETLAAGGFDGAVIFTVYTQSPLPAALLCLLAGVPLRAAHCRENPYRLLTDWFREPEPETVLRHEAQRQLDLAAGLGAPARDERLSLGVGEPARRRVAELIGPWDLGARTPGAPGPAVPWAVVHPGASAPSRRWRTACFGETLAALNREEGWRFVLTGLADEVPLVEETLEAARDCGAEDGALHSVCGLVGLEELAALLEAAPLLLANNTGPVHVAAAVGTPVVDLYALTNPQHSPWRVPHRVLFHDVPCKYCYKSVCPLGHNNCLQLVTPDEAGMAVRELYRDVYRTGAA